MAKGRKKKSRGGSDRDVSGGIVKSEERKWVTLTLGDRVIKAPPFGPVKTKQWSGHVKPVKKAYKSRAHKNKIDNAALKGEKYWTVFAREYVAPINTSQYRERDKIHPLSQYNKPTLKSARTASTVTSSDWSNCSSLPLLRIALDKERQYFTNILIFVVGIIVESPLASRKDHTTDDAKTRPGSE
ncbi:hypothetical protein CAPTEDRAFT_213326 [Capitella teleta]|uniref:Uncharacterized protein n=1 Tax=Capitella teleta TaxID=283909 RepID=R7TVY6_CAPTE|nr:hypothetical protein CAPTEDRAFT_213326 [Capitella teleta]|eukprot:ELT95626.1 hypothetical protein CAPTEDRAFT_213326 [Capitella teleta]